MRLLSLSESYYPPNGDYTGTSNLNLTACIIFSVYINKGVSQIYYLVHFILLNFYFFSSKKQSHAADNDSALDNGKLSFAGTTYIIFIKKLNYTVLVKNLKKYSF
jgi:hypothetical protein